MLFAIQGSVDGQRKYLAMLVGGGYKERMCLLGLPGKIKMSSRLKFWWWKILSRQVPEFQLILISEGWRTSEDDLSSQVDSCVLELAVLQES